MEHIAGEEKEHISELNVMLEFCDGEQKLENEDAIVHVHDIVDRAKMDLFEYVEEKKVKLESILSM